MLAAAALSLGGCALAGQPLKRARMATALPSPTTAPLVVPADTPAPDVTRTVPPEEHTVLACPDRTGSLRPESVPSTILGGEYQFLAYLPPCYEASPEQTYPALFLFHGLGRSPDQWVSLGLEETADRLILNGDIPPILIILPMIPGDDSSDAAFLADLLPAVDGNFQTRPEKQFRSVGGLSRGAEWALRLAVRRADLFGMAGLHSPAFSPDLLPQLREWMSVVPESLRPLILADVGSSDPMRNQTEELFALLDESDWPRDFLVWPGDHSDEYWRNNLSAYLVRYGTPWK
jgi:enterochelin esterase-like enzyme